VFPLPLRTVYIVAGAALFLAMLAAGYEKARADRWQLRGEAAESRVVELADANQGQVTTIAALERAVEKWKALATPARPELGPQADADRRRLEAELAAAYRKARELDNGKADCAALLAQDLGRACPFIAGGLRERAEGRR
jgi:hypothetical protein